MSLRYKITIAISGLFSTVGMFKLLSEIPLFTMLYYFIKIVFQLMMFFPISGDLDQPDVGNGRIRRRSKKTKTVWICCLGNAEPGKTFLQIHRKVNQTLVKFQLLNTVK